jgi:hypothetical protein
VSGSSYSSASAAFFGLLPVPLRCSDCDCDWDIPSCLMSSIIHSWICPGPWGCLGRNFGIGLVCQVPLLFSSTSISASVFYWSPTSSSDLYRCLLFLSTSEVSADVCALARALRKCSVSSSDETCMTLISPMSAVVYLCLLVFHSWSAISFGSGINSIFVFALCSRKMSWMIGYVRFSFKKEMIGS